MRAETALQKELWITKDPIYKLGILLSKMSGSDTERYGAAAIIKSGIYKQIVGIGWNVYAAGKVPYRRQQYANHAEATSAAVAEASGVDFNDGSAVTVFVSGGSPDSLFFNPDGTPFTCKMCADFMTEAGVANIASPSVEGWRVFPIDQATDSANGFKAEKQNNHSNATQQRNSISAAQVHPDVMSDVEITDEYIEKLVSQLNDNGYDLSRNVAITLSLLPQVFKLPRDLRRRFLEGLGDQSLRVKRSIERSKKVKQQIYFEGGSVPFWFKTLGQLIIVTPLYSRALVRKQLDSILRSDFNREYEAAPNEGKREVVNKYETKLALFQEYLEAGS